MFEDSLLESGNRFKAGGRRATTALSFVVQGLLLGVLVLIPLIYTEALPQQELMTFLVAPPPPPPPPPPPMAPAMQVVKPIASNMVSGQLHTPTRIPEKVEMVKEEDPPPVLGSAVGGVVGGVVGGTPGGVLGGVLAAAAPTVAVAPKPVIPTRLKVSQGVMQANLIRQVKPVYPLLAKQARISGTVVLQAIINKDGLVENLTLKQGHPILAPAAIEAVKQWRYKPTLLNGEPVEVEVVISVNFTLTGG
jgi:protein TonB